MKKTRRKFTAAFKAKVSIEAIKEQSSLSELAKKFELHPNQISQWKQEFLTNSASVFESGNKSRPAEKEVDSKALYEKIGKLEMEKDYLKKSLKRLEQL